MDNKEIKSSSLSEMKDKYIGVVGTKNRDKYERKLQSSLLKVWNRENRNGK